MAERTTRPSGSEVDFGRFSRMAIASSALFPLIRSVTRRAFLGERRRKRAEAFTSISGTGPYVRRALGRPGTRGRPPRPGGGGAPPPPPPPRAPPPPRGPPRPPPPPRRGAPR